VSGISARSLDCAPIALIDTPAAMAQASEPERSPPIFPHSRPAGAGSGRRHTGLQLIYVSGVVRDQRSHRVRGNDANEALARVLEGTGLEFRFLTPRSIRIFATVAGPAGVVGPRIEP